MISIFFLLISFSELLISVGVWGLRDDEADPTPLRVEGRKRAQLECKAS